MATLTLDQACNAVESILQDESIAELLGWRDAGPYVEHFREIRQTADAGAWLRDVVAAPLHHHFLEMIAKVALWQDQLSRIIDNRKHLVTIYQATYSRYRESRLHYEDLGFAADCAEFTALAHDFPAADATYSQLKAVEGEEANTRNWRDTAKRQTDKATRDFIVIYSTAQWLDPVKESDWEKETNDAVNWLELDRTLDSRGARRQYLARFIDV